MPNVDTQLKSQIHKGVFLGMVPLKTLGGGDCFFSAISLSMTGDKNLVSMFRLLTLSMVAKYDNFFDNQGMR
jgi:hypothetical protein